MPFSFVKLAINLLGIVAGGVTATGTVVNLVEVYTPGQACQKTLAPMPSSSSDPVLAFMSGTILLIESIAKNTLIVEK